MRSNLLFGAVAVAVVLPLAFRTERAVSFEVPVAIADRPGEAPYLLEEDLPAHPDCDTSRKSFGGPPTIADFNGDGSREVGVAGACWFTIYDVSSSGLQYYALTQTRDWSSASTGSTVFDFNGDGTDEVVFSDEDAVYVWQIDSAGGLRPWERVDEVLFDDNHKSWTIHETPSWPTSMATGRPSCWPSTPRGPPALSICQT